MFKSKKEPLKYFGQLNDGQDLEDFEQRSNLNNYLKSLGSVPKEDISLEKTNVTTEYLDVPVFEGRDYLKEAEQKDREMYIEFFGTEAEKEALRLEKEEAKNKGISEALRLEDEKNKAIEKEKLELEMQEKAKVLAEELEVKRRAEELLKEKDLEEQRNKDTAQKIIGKYVRMLNKIDPLVNKLKEVPKDYWLPEELTLVENLDDYAVNMNLRLVTLKNKTVYTTFDDDEIKLYTDFSGFYTEYLDNAPKLRDKVDYLLNRAYPLEVSQKLDKAFYAILDYLFEYMENRVIDKDLFFKIENERLDMYGNKSKYAVKVIKKVSDDGTLTNISAIFEFRNGLNSKALEYKFMADDYKYKKLDVPFEQFFVEVISKHWHDYTLANDVEPNVGIKNKFIEQAKLYVVKHNLAYWQI